MIMLVAFNGLFIAWYYRSTAIRGAVEGWEAEREIVASISKWLLPIPANRHASEMTQKQRSNRARRTAQSSSLTPAQSEGRERGR